MRRKLSAQEPNKLKIHVKHLIEWITQKIKVTDISRWLVENEAYWACGRVRVKKLLCPSKIWGTMRHLCPPPTLKHLLNSHLICLLNLSDFLIFFIKIIF